MPGSEFFGSDEQQAVLRRGKAMAELLATDPRYTYYGRTVGLATPQDGGVDKLAALVRVQGNSNFAHVPDADVPAFAEALIKLGLKPMIYNKWVGDAEAVNAARSLLARTNLPADLALRRLDATTPAETFISLAETALTCGVLPAARASLDGTFGKSVCFVAEEPSGRVVSVAAASAFAHPDHALGGQAWWGMLATHPDRRGERLSLILGAHAMVAMEADYGFANFMTGVEPGNAPSEAVCLHMGLEHDGYSILGCSDPVALSGGRMTK